MEKQIDTKKIDGNIKEEKGLRDVNLGSISLLSTKWRILAPAFLLILNLLSLFASEESVLSDYIVLLPLTLFTIPFFKIIRFKNIGTVFFFSYIQLSLVWSKFFTSNLENEVLHFDSHPYSVIVGAICQSLICLLYIVIYKKEKSSPKLSSGLSLNAKLEVCTSIVFFTIAFLLSFISYQLGVSQMGAKTIILPYKLEPLLNITRGLVIPGVFPFLIHYFSKSGRRILIANLVTILIWCLLEVYFKGSRGFFLVATLPLAIYFLRFLTFDLKQIAKVSFIFLVVNIFLVLFANYLRDSRSHSTSNAKEFNFAKTLSTPYFRLFPDGILLDKFERYKPKSLLQTNHKLYSKYKNGTLVHTRLIDGFKEGEPHNSGITAISDGYLYAGGIGLFASALLLMIIYTILDFFLVFSPPLYAGLIFYFINCTVFGEGFISYFYRSPLTYLALPMALIGSYFCIMGLLSKKGSCYSS